MARGIVPTAPELAREALIVIGGALLAAVVMSQFPGVKAWIKEQWS
jgi:predicted secreted protein